MLSEIGTNMGVQSGVKTEDKAYTYDEAIEMAGKLYFILLY